MEPELGVGAVAAMEGRRITLRFSECALTRICSAASAPLQRVICRPRDRVTAEGGAGITIAAVEVQEGLNVCGGDGRRLREDRLRGGLTVNRPDGRLNPALPFAER